MEVSYLCCVFYILEGGAWVSIGDVLAYGAREHKDILKYDPNVLPDR